MEVFIISIFGVLLFALGFLFGSMDKETKKEIEKVQKPLEIKYTQHNAKKWTACKRISGDEYMRTNPDAIEHIMASNFARQFEGIIKDHMTVEKDPFRYEVIYRVEMWID